MFVLKIIFNYINVIAVKNTFHEKNYFGRRLIYINIKEFECNLHN
jgi:hypothetical protein